MISPADMSVPWTALVQARGPHFYAEQRVGRLHGAIGLGGHDWIATASVDLSAVPKGEHPLDLPTQAHQIQLSLDGFGSSQHGSPI